MNQDMIHVRSLLFDEMELALSTSCVLFSKIEEEHWDFRPRDNMRSLVELARHLANAPAQELAILQEWPMEEVRQLPQLVANVRGAESLANVMHGGVQALKAYMTSLDEADFLYKKTAPFFAKHQPAAQVKWLIEITTHLYHHRGQMFTYMKQLGIPVSMLDLYGPASDTWTL